MDRASTLRETGRHLARKGTIVMAELEGIFSESTETFPLGVKRFYAEDDEIAVVVSTGDMSHGAIDEWVDVMTDTIQQRVDVQQPVFMLTTSAVEEQGFSRYAQKRVEGVLNAVPNNFPVYAAMVFPPGIISQFVSVFLNSMMRRSAKQIRAEMFTDREHAITWLNHMRARHNETIINQAV